MNGMSENRDPETILAAWLDEGPNDLPGETRRAILAALPTTPQARRGPFAPWRLFPMTTPIRLAAIGAAIILAGAGALAVLGPGSGPGTPTAAPTASPQPSTAPTTLLPPAMSTPFSSTSFGYEARYPSGWRAASGTTTGSAAELALGEPQGPARFWDHFEPDQATPGPRLLATSTVIPVGTTEDAWIDAYQEPQIQQAGAACTPARDAWDPVTIDGTSGGIYVGCGFVEAMTFVEGRVYVFSYVNFSAAQSVVETTGRQVLEAFVATVSLRPQQAAEPSPTSS
jgi:hypothetical protein